MNFVFVQSDTMTEHFERRVKTVQNYGSIACLVLLLGFCYTAYVCSFIVILAQHTGPETAVKNTNVRCVTTQKSE
jgi:hypothetical protein